MPTKISKIPNNPFPDLFVREINRNGTLDLELALFAGSHGRNGKTSPVDVFVSWDNEVTWEILKRNVSSSTYGVLRTTLSPSTPRGITFAQSADVEIYSGQISTTTVPNITGQGANRGLFGEEICAYLTVTPGTAPDHTIQSLWRGLAGTDPTTSHDAGMMFADVGSASWASIHENRQGRNAVLAPATQGWPVESHQVRYALTVTGASAFPVHATAPASVTNGGTGERTLSWFSGPACFDDPTAVAPITLRPWEWYEIQVLNGGTPVRSIEINPPRMEGSALFASWAYDVPMITADGYTAVSAIPMQIRARNQRGAGPWLTFTNTV